MSGLFSTLSLTNRALQNYQTAIQTTGHNIANANTEGYSRQRVEITSNQPQFIGGGYVGTGADVTAITRAIDQGLQSRMQYSESQLGRYDTVAQYLSQVEVMFGELSDTDLSSAMENFFNALNDFSNRPEDLTARTQVLQNAQYMADSFGQLAVNLNQLRTDMSNQIEVQVGEINRLATEIAGLNEEIQRLEVGGARFGQANDLRDRREQALRELSNLVQIRTHETSTGVVNVLIGSDFLVLDDDIAEVGVKTTVTPDSKIKTPVFTFDNKELELAGGALYGLVEARDTLVGGYLNDLNTLANTVIREMNNLQAQGRGLVGQTSVTSGVNLSDGLDSTTPLNQAGLPFPITDGSFNIRVVNELTNTTTEINIEIDQDGLNNNDTTLESLRDQINAKLSLDFPMMSATINTDGSFTLSSADPNFTFYFNNDNTGVLSALGMNRFFAGSRAIDIVVAPELGGNPQLLAGATSTNPGDNSNASAMAQLRYQKLFNNNTTTVEDFYQGIVGTLGVQAADYQSRAINQDYLNTQLVNERESLSGVNLDEEATNLITFQRAFQAAARVISVIDQMMQTLLNV